MTRARRCLIGGSAAACVTLVAAVALLPAPHRGREAQSQPPDVSAGSGGDPAGGPPPAAGSALPYAHVVALVIGIDDYPNLLPRKDLRQAEADARAVADVFRREFGYEVVTLTGAKATKAGVLDLLDRHGRAVGDQDALVVYFAGHGQVIDLPVSGEAGFLVPSDAALDLENKADLARWERQAIDMKGVVDGLNRTPAKHVLLIADACCSGYMTGAARGALADPDLKHFLANPARTVLAATTRRQGARDGLFTPALLRQLRALDRPGARPEAASVYDLFQPLLKEVGRASEGNMTPQVSQVGDGDGMFVFVPTAVPRAEVDAALRGAGVRRQAELKQFTTPAEVYALTDASDYRFAVDAEDRRRAWEDRLERYRRNAQVGDAWAMAALHFCYAAGIGADKDAGLAYFWARQADRSNQAPGLGRYLLGRCYEAGTGVGVAGPGGQELSRRLFRESEKQGCVLGRYAVAADKARGGTAPGEAADGRRALAECAHAGVHGSELELANDLLRPRPDPANPADAKAAVALLEKGELRESAACSFRLYEVFGRGVPPVLPADMQRAATHLAAAAGRGHPEALYVLGSEYALGKPGGLKLVPDERRGFQLLDRAAQAGHGGAAVKTAVMLAKGRGVAVDQAAAKQRLEDAVRRGSAEASYTKGGWHLDGFVLAMSDEEAVASFRRAADGGHVRASYAAGMLMAQGRGIPVRRWLREPAFVLFHDDWHTAMHYLCKYLRDTKDPKSNGDYQFAATLLHGFDNATKNGYVFDTWNRFLQQQMLFCKQPDWAIKKRTGDLLDQWKAEYPDTAKWFAENGETVRGWRPDGE